MAADEIRIGFVGCGGIGNHHLKVWQQTPGAKLVAVCDIVPERAQKAAETYGGEPFTDLAEMLDKVEFDAADICTFSGVHAENAMMCIQAGKHVMVEKPIDLDVKKVDKLLDMADASGLVLACIFNNRVGAEIRRANQLIQEGALGKLISGSTYIKWWRAQSYYDSDAWRGTWALDGGCLSNQGIHAIDQLCWMCGPVKEVNYSHIETAMHKMEAEDVGMVILTFENGAHGVIEGTTCCYPGMGMKTEVFGTKGSALFESNRVTKFEVQGEKIDLSSQEAQKADGRSDPLAIGLEGHAAQLLDFVNCIREGTQPLVTGREARVAVDALTKIYQRAGVPKIGT